MRRIIRLDFVYLFVIIIAIILAYVVGGCGAGSPSAEFAGVLPCPRFDLAGLSRNVFYFLPIDGPFWLPVAWTLAVEVHFYLFMASLFALTNRFRLGSVAPAILCVLSLSSLAFPAGFLGLIHADWLVPTLFNLLAGSLIYLFLFRPSRMVQISLAMFLLGLAAIYVWGGALSNVLATLISCAFMLASFDKRLLWLSNIGVVQRLGRYSYGIYLFHMLVGQYFVVPLARSEMPFLTWGPVPLVLGILLTVFLAAIGYHWIEFRSIGWSKRVGG